MPEEQNPLTPEQRKTAAELPWPTRDLLIWCAGFYDGEGSTHLGRIHHRPKPRFKRGRLEYVLKVQVQQGTWGDGPPDTLLRLQSAFGGSVNPLRRDLRNPTRKSMYIWGVSARKGRRALALMLPWLSDEKQEQADRARVRCRDGRDLQREWLLAHDGVAARGERSGGAKMTALQVKELRRRHAAGERPVDLARDFGIASTTASHIALRRTWRHVA